MLPNSSVIGGALFGARPDSRWMRISRSGRHSLTASREGSFLTIAALKVP